MYIYLNPKTYKYGSIQKWMSEKYQLRIRIILTDIVFYGSEAFDFAGRLRSIYEVSEIPVFQELAAWC